MANFKGYISVYDLHWSSTEWHPPQASRSDHLEWGVSGVQVWRSSHLWSQHRQEDILSYCRQHCLGGGLGQSPSGKEGWVLKFTAQRMVNILLFYVKDKFNSFSDIIIRSMRKNDENINESHICRKVNVMCERLPLQNVLRRNATKLLLSKEDNKPTLQGWLTKVKHGHARRCWCVLIGKMFIYFKNPNDQVSYHQEWSSM